MEATCTCNPVEVDGFDFSPFWGQYFGECIYTPNQNAALICGLISILLYAVALVPQFLKNYQRKSVQGLSLNLFLAWLVGDIANTLGCFLTQQFTTQKVTGIYFIISEICIILQHAYYTKFYEPVLPKPSSETNSLLCSSVPLVLVASMSYLVYVSPTVLNFDIQNSLDNVFQLPAALPLCDENPILDPTFLMVGNILSWFGGLFYFVSRFPQIWINYKNKSIEGLSLSLISITLVANLFYGFSILLRMHEIELVKFVSSTLPFVIGSMGTCVSDIVVIYQAYIYRTKGEIDLIPASPKT